WPYNFDQGLFHISKRNLSDRTINHKSFNHLLLICQYDIPFMNFVASCLMNNIRVLLHPLLHFLLRACSIDNESTCAIDKSTVSEQHAGLTSFRQKRKMLFSISYTFLWIKHWQKYCKMLQLAMLTSTLITLLLINVHACHVVISMPL